MPLSQDNLPVKVTTPFSDVLVVRSFQAEERVSGLFRYTLEMTCENPALEFTRVVGQGVSVSIALAGGGTRYFHGLCTRFVQAGTWQGITTYHAELRPWLWMLTLAQDCRIWQNQTVPDLVLALFKELGFTDVKSALQGTYKPREYCVQFRERTFDFVSRLLEEEGISYWFEHAAAAHTLVLADDPAAFAVLPDLATARYATSTTGAEMQDVVSRCTLEQRVVTGSIALDDYNFETPATDLYSTVEGALGMTMLAYDSPGRFGVTADGETRARVRLDAVEAEATRLSGESACRAFTPGYAFTLAGHERPDVNAKYALLAVVHNADQRSYSNSFEAIPATTQYRPPRTTRKPRIGGAQVATVVGKSGEEIWTDQYGRIVVQFPWDRLGKNDEKSSCWIRVAQGWAGKAWGSVFIPRVGMEVVVSFLDGDPDQPIVSGCVYNATQTVPYALPGEQTKSTIKSNSSKGGGGFNELRFEDKKGSEEIFFHAQKDLNLVVLNNQTDTITQDRTATVQKGNESLTVSEGNRTVTVTKGNDAHTVSTGNRTVTVSKGDDTHTVSQGNWTIAVTKGDEAHTVGGKRDVKVTGDETHTNSATFTHKSGGNYTLKVTGDLVIDATGNVTIKAGQGLTLKAGMGFTAEGGTSFSAKAGTAMAIEGGTTLDAKANASTTVQSSGIMTVKGSLVKIN